MAAESPGSPEPRESRPDPLPELVRRLVSAGAEPTARELAEALWLARHVDPVAPSLRAPAEQAVAGAPAGDARGPAGDVPGPAGGGGGTDGPPERTERTRLYADHPRHRGRGPGTAEGLERVRVPMATALPQPLALVRALRPLQRYRAPVRRVEDQLDEQATAERAALTGLLLPVSRSSTRREARIRLVMDVSTSTPVWQRTLGELSEILAGTGAFREILVHHVREAGDGRLLIGPARDGSRPFWGAEQLRDPSGRQLTLVLSDCAGPLWRAGRMQRLIHRWSAVAPVALVQPLPQRMWRRTHLPALPGTLRRPEGLASRLAFVPLEGGTAAGPVPVPVLAPTGAGLGAWACLLSTSTGLALPAAAGWVGPDHAPALPVGTDRTPPPAELIGSFRRTASRPALQLAVALSAVPLSLPVMQLVQRSTAPGTGPSVLAEVLLSGLLRRAEPDGWYEFVPGVREALLRALPLGEALLVLKYCGEYVERHFGRRAHNFPALARACLTGEEHSDGNGELLTPQAFADVSALVVRRYAQAAAGRGAVREREAEERARAEEQTRAVEEARAEERAQADARVRAEQRARAEERVRIEQRVRAEERLRADERARAEEEGRADERARAEERLRADERARAEEEVRIAEERVRAEERERAEQRARAAAREQERARAEAPTHPEESGRVGNVVLVYSGSNRPWAVWLAHRLEAHGLGAALSRWDPAPGQRLEDELRRLLPRRGSVLMVLSENFFATGDRTDREWNTAWSSLAPSELDRFAAVALTEARLPATPLEPVTLWGVDAYEAEYRVLRRLRMPTERIRAETGRRGPRFPNDPPEIWGRVPRRNTRFTGRDDLMARLHTTLSEAPRSGSAVTLLGLSGIGKTQIAVEYAHRFAAEYDAVWWVPAEDRATARERLVELAPALGLPRGAGSHGDQIRAVLEALRRGTPHDRWLIVFDGCDNPDDLTDLLPSGPGDIIITSRNREWASRHTSIVEVPLYDRSESVAFVRRRAVRLTAAEADRLAEALGDYPLALDQAAGWLADSPLGVGEYVALLEGVDSREPLTLSEDYPLPFQTALAILLNNIRVNFPDALTLLRLFVFFAPGPVPLWLLRDFPAREVPERVAGMLGDPVRWNEALNKLVQFSVVHLEHSDGPVGEGSGGTGTAQIQRTVHRVVRENLSEEEAEPLARAVQRVLVEAAPGRPTDSRLWPRYAELVPHLGPSGALTSSDPSTRTFLLDCVRYLVLAGEYPACLRLCEDIGRSWRSVLGADHPTLRELASLHITVLRLLGRPGQAEEAFRELLPGAGPGRGRSRQDLREERARGLLLLALGRYEEAREWIEPLVHATRELLGRDDSTTLQARHDLATAYRLLGRYQEAHDLDQETLLRRERMLRARHPSTLSSVLAHAVDLRLLGHYREARALQEQGVRRVRQMLGPSHPLALSAEHNLAMCLRGDGDLPGAGQLLRTVRERAARLFGADSPGALAVACDHAAYLREHGDIDEARGLSEDVLRAYERQLGRAHPYAIGAMGNLALVLRAQGEREEALSLAEQGLAGMRGALGTRHPWTLGCALNVTAHRQVRGHVEEALSLSRETLRGAEQAFGPTHPMTFAAQIALAADLRVVRAREEADKYEDAGIRGLASTLGVQHVQTVAARQRSRPYWDFAPIPE
ncbi:FxSxx-COOH system tetratricopeptide repeat protein [Streptomyces sp. G1]|uniref:FxSxx-COOH system tetratricopeptide repeat protein n=1 Tax=Streptomyces sp. G1 TaxID=361572 RepID=UPI00202E2A36|nr:FxSxx-COOH system tetratricopeptide repeat protein [Streptomyces sp. G1]MCM1973573.1 FxSxx-COOH system tetratricopeptide repeat protein [Streptomyces sp. G1]